MRTKSIALMMASLLSALPVCAMAQPMSGPGGGPGGGGGGGQQHGGGRGGQPQGNFGGRGGGGRGGGGGEWRQNQMRPAPGPGGWRAGNRYWGGDPWIDNWQTYPGLYAPPYGYRWVQAGNQFLLTAIASGVISAVVAQGMMGGPR
ncbi:RcnB family protein [Acetobacter conturbans]|uniref:RcnB family protein n=1 Tax=Acetobacter conturbans TaxID=1737472 RepID=A0ABX0K2R0_9PROT|nr:RcnB family protein [Acetobacter conturbans]NHN88978.1 hypothetical protein [Acetobacter conturbans]